MRKERGDTLLEVVMTLVIVVIMVVGLFAGLLVDKSVAVRAMETQGFSEVEVVDRAWFMVSLRGCDKSDSARFTVVAKNPVGKKVTCYVCSGWLFKGATIRTN